MRVLKIFIILIFPLFLNAQGKIIGKVYDAVSGKGLPMANVIIKGTKIGTSCDIDGSFILLKVPPGEHILVASMIGYKPEEEKVVIKDGEVKEVYFYLHEEVFKVQELVVVGEKPLLEKDVSSSKRTISSEELEAIHTEDIKGILERQAGFQGQGTDIHVRGGRSNEVLLLIDGLPIKDPLSGSAFGIYVPVSAVKELEALTGGFNAEYGQAMSGVINLQVREGGEKFTGNLMYKRDNIGNLSEKIGLKNHFNKDIFSLTLSGPELISRELAKLFKLNIPGSITYFFNLYAKLEDTYLPHVDKLYTSVYNTDKLSPREENSYSAVGKITWRISNSRKLSFLFSRSLEINQGYFNSRSDYPFAYGFPYRYIHILDNYLTFTRDGIQTALLWHHALSPVLYYDLKLSRFFTNLHADVQGKHWSEYEELVDTIPGDRFWDYGDAPYWHDHYVETYTSKFDLVKIFSKVFRMKTGFITNRSETQWIDIQYPWYSTEGGLGLNHDLYRTVSWNGGIYVQGQIHFAGMIANVGTRLDFWIPGKYADDGVKRSLEDPDLPPLVKKEYENYLNENIKIRGRIVKAHISPRIGVAYPITEKDKFFFSYGHFSQLPDLKYVYSKLGVRASSTYELVGNPNLNPTITVAYEMGMEHLFNDYLKVKATAYYKDIFNYPTAMKVPGIPPNPSYWMYFNSDYSRSVGVEISFTRRLYNHLYGNAELTISQSKGRSSTAEDLYWRGTTESLKEWYLKWDRPVKFYGILGFVVREKEHYKLGPLTLNDFKTSIGVSVQSGRRYTPVDTLGNYGDPNSGIGPLWHRVDFKMEKGITPLKGLSKVILKFEVRNVFNHRNVYYVNPVTGKAYKPGDPLPPRTEPEDMLNPRRFTAPREILIGVETSW